MAIDFDAIRKKLGQISGQNSKRNQMWRPQEGEEATVRIVAFPNNDGQPFKERWFYYNIGNNSGLLSPHQFGKPDPFQELITKLRDEASKESYELAKKLYPKMRVYAAVIVRGEEEKGIRLWSFGKMVYQNLLNIMLDPDYGDITDPFEGHDIRVICTKQPGRQYATTEVRPRPKTTELGKPGKVKEWMKSIPNLDDMYSLKSYDELEKIINDWLNGDSSDTDASIGTKRTGYSKEKSEPSYKSSKPERTTTSTNNKAFDDLDDAFADLEATFTE